MNAAADVPAAVQRLTAPEDRRAPQTAAEAAAVQPAAVAEPQAQTKEKLPVRTILKTVWLAGAAILAGVMLAQNLRFLRKLRRVRQPLACAESPIPVWLVPGLPSPCLAGLFRPEIYLTPEAAADPATLGFVLRHELAHFRAKDQLWSLVRLVCQCVYWFDPFVWLAAALARRDCELACDARVLRGLDGESRAAYGRALLGLVTVRPGGGQLLSGATTMQLGKKSLTERITLIAKKPKMAACTLVFVLLLCLALAACTFTGASAQPEPEPETAQSEVQPQPAPEPESTADTEAPQPVEDDPEASFQMAFPMLNYATFQRYLAEHPETLADGWEHIRINEAGFDDDGTSIETKQGDQVLAIDAEYGILLVRVTGEGYRGVLAVCRYPELLRLEMAADPGAEGELAGNIASDHGGILAMNANGFLDPNGEGDGSQLAGWCMSNGEGYGTHFADGAYQRIELSENGLNCRIVPASDPVGEGTYSAAEFMPAHPGRRKARESGLDRRAAARVLWRGRSGHLYARHRGQVPGRGHPRHERQYLRGYPARLRLPERHQHGRRLERHLVVRRRIRHAVVLRDPALHRRAAAAERVGLRVNFHVDNRRKCGKISAISKKPR